MKTLLTIAGFDPSSGAGVTADLAVFAAHGYFGVSAITGLTVQSTQGVRRTQAVDRGFLAETLACLAEDVEIAGIKIGMLTTAVNVEAVAAFVQTRSGIPVVLDPVLKSSSGRDLLEPNAVETLRQHLLPLATWVTPNRQELASIGEIPPHINLIVTGGDHDATDCVSIGGTETLLRGERLESRATHGTGCAFSSALLCRLIEGCDGIEAARQAKYYVTEAIRRAPTIGRGRGPMALGWPRDRQV